MSNSTSLTLTLHHDGDAVTADVAHPASNTHIRGASMADLVRVIHEHGDSLRPAPTGSWERLLTRNREDSPRTSA